jgi:DNA polymerase III subunit delta
MPTKFLWGEDDFAVEKAVANLREPILDPNWSSFNYTVIYPDQTDGAIEGLNQVMTPPFGMGARVVWLVNTNICESCPEQVLSELERTLPVIPEQSLLILTSRSKPDERLKSTKLLKKYATFQNFPLIAPWETSLLEDSVKKAAAGVGVKLTPKSVELLVQSVGNNTRLLYTELEKLRLYAINTDKALDDTTIEKLVRNTTQNSLKLSSAILEGDTAKALTLVFDLLNAGEPSIRITATLIGVFRTWTWVKLMTEAGVSDQQVIAKAADIANPKRIFILQKEIRSISSRQLLATLPILLDLEVSLKRGATEMPTLQTKVIELCQVFKFPS